jgi:hypothetical protein
MGTGRGRSARGTNFKRDAAARARKARELAEQKTKQTETNVQRPKEAQREDPYSRLLRKIDEENRHKNKQ